MSTACTSSRSPPAMRSRIGAPPKLRKRTPSACARPAPASLVAEPPMPRMISVTPRLIASAMSSPVPKVVATSGSRCSLGTSGRPEASAISMTAVLPSPSRPYEAITLSAHRAGNLGLDDLAAGGVDERLHGALAAVGHRHLDVGGVWPDPLEARLDLARHFQGGQVFFEGVGGDNDLHRALLLTEAWPPTANRREDTGKDCTVSRGRLKLLSFAGVAGKPSPSHG